MLLSLMERQSRMKLVALPCLSLPSAAITGWLSASPTLHHFYILFRKPGIKESNRT